MIKCGIVVPEFYKGDRLFDIHDKISNRDNNLYHWLLLKNKFTEYGVELSTYDRSRDKEYSTIIFPDMPNSSQFDLKSKSNIGRDLYLVIFESELIKLENWDIDRHKYFTKIFTWNDSIVDGKKYIKYCWPNTIPHNTHFNNIKKNALCTMIAAHKQNKHPLELYSERVKAIRWFEKYHPEKFDLFGMGWNKYIFTGKLSYLNKYDFIRKLHKPKYPSYKGTVISKNDKLRNYKYSLCYENARDISGYITEKIFDSFFAGCVPIYLGAPNVTDYIPPDTFIDKRQYPTYESLYKYLAEMSDSEYNGYQGNIQAFLTSQQMHVYSAEKFVEIISTHILNV